ncbi:MAG: lipoyl synthase [Candidatus Margulisiibacteriota bacterium]
MALPKYPVKRIPKQKNTRRIREVIDDCNIHTVCESAKCPNIGECFSDNTLTFMILGNICTRSCSFCGVKKGQPPALDPEEPQRIAQAVKKLGLNYVVITSVTRDDLADGGASQFAKVISHLRTHNSELRTPNSKLKTEVLIPDFQGNENALKIVLDAKPYVLNHNVETVPRLYPDIRPQANYQQSLDLLRRAKKSQACTERNRGVYTKSGFMVGLGETKEEVFNVLKDLKTAGCDIVTIGQYLSPSRAHPKAERYVHPDEFKEYEVFGKNLGLEVFAGPFVRSSYHAGKKAEGLNLQPGSGLMPSKVEVLK